MTTTLLTNPTPESLAPTPAPTPTTLPGCTRLSDLISQPLTWLWPHRIPFDALTLLDAEPGLGSSLFTLTLAALVSSGSTLPGGTSLTQRTVLLVAPNDSPTRTILPRLTAAGADLAHVVLLTSTPDPSSPDPHSTSSTPKQTSPHDAAHDRLTSASPSDPLPGEHAFSLPSDLAHLEAVITAEHAGLVILDPLSAILSAPQRSSQASPASPTLPPSRLFAALTRVAERTHCAILLIRHLSPGQTPSLTRYGSCPVHLHLLPDPDHDDQRLLCTVKNILSPPVPHLTYRLTATPTGIPLLTCLGTNRFLHRVIQSSAHSSLSANRQAVIRVLTQASRPLTLAEIATQTSLPPETIRLLVSRMTQSAELFRPHRGAYTTPTHPCLDTSHSPWPILFSPDLLQFLHSPFCTFDSLIHHFPEVQHLSMQGMLDLLKNPLPLPPSPDPEHFPFQPFPPATTDTDTAGDPLPHPSSQ